jgi:hypothetical protein
MRFRYSTLLRLSFSFPALEPRSRDEHTMPVSKTLRMGAVLSAVISAAGGRPASAADPQSSAELQREIRDLQDKLDALQRRVDAADATERQTRAEADSAAAQASAAGSKAEAAAAAVPGQVQASLEADKGKSDKIHYKGVTITLGGFVEGAAVYREHDTNNDIASAYNSIPFNSSQTVDTRQFLFTARASRFSVLVQGDANAATHLSGYTELDFQGAAQTANSKESNSYTPRLRQEFAALDLDDLGLHVLAGQAWSLLTLNSVGINPFTVVNPPTVDSSYVPGFTWARQPQLRITKDFDRQLWLALSLENPQTTFYTGANALPSDVHLTYEAAGTGLGFNSANELSLNRIPDVIGKVAYDLGLADRKVHVEAYGLFSDFYERLDYANKNTSGGGWGGGVMVPVVPQFLDFQISGLAGKGIGRYGSGQLTEVTFDPTGQIAPIHEIIALAGVTLHATPRFDWYLFAGEDKESAQSYDLESSSGAITPYGYGNPLYSNVGCNSYTGVGTCVGNESRVEQATTGFWWRPLEGDFGTLRWGVQYSHTEFQTFEGKGGAPGAIQNVVFVSFRYYPFTEEARSRVPALALRRRLTAGRTR